MGEHAIFRIRRTVASPAGVLGRLRRVPDAITVDWLMMTIGSLVRLAIGFVASVLIARALGPVDLGIYATLAAIATTTGAVAEFGLTESAVRRIAINWPGDSTAAGDTAATYVWLRAGLTTLMVVGAVTLVAIGAEIGITPERPLLVSLALLGIIATALSGSVSGLLQATGRFGRLSLVMVANSALTALLALLLAVAGTLNLTTALIVLGIGTSLTCVGLGRSLLDDRVKLIPPSWSIFRAEAGMLLRFGRWLWLANFLAMLAAQLDLLLAGHWLTPVALGAYALAVTLASKAAVVNQSLHAVLLPVAASLRSSQSIRTYLRRALARSLLIAATLIVATPLARWLIPLFFGGVYRQAVGLFTALLGVAILDIIATPMLLLAYTADRPKLIVIADAIRVVVLALGAALLLPLVGIYGLVLAKLLASLAGFAWTAVALVPQFKADGFWPASALALEDVAVESE